MKRVTIFNDSVAASSCAFKPATATVGPGRQQILLEPSTAEPSASEESDDSDPFEVERLGWSSMADGGTAVPPGSSASHGEDGVDDDDANADANEIGNETGVEVEVQAGADSTYEDAAEDSQLALASRNVRLQGAAERPLALASTLRFDALEIDGVKGREPLLRRLLCHIVNKRRRRSV